MATLRTTSDDRKVIVAVEDDNQTTFVEWIVNDNDGYVHSMYSDDLPVMRKEGDVGKRNDSLQLRRLNAMGITDCDAITKQLSDYDGSLTKFVNYGVKRLTNTTTYNLSSKLYSSNVSLTNYNAFVRNSDILNHLFTTGHYNVVFIYSMCGGKVNEETFNSAQELIESVKGDMSRAEWNILLGFKRPTIHLLRDDANGTRKIRSVCRSIAKSNVPPISVDKDMVKLLLEGFHRCDRFEEQHESMQLIEYNTSVLQSGVPLEALREQYTNTLDFIVENQPTAEELRRWTWFSTTRRSRDWHENMRIGRIINRYPRGITWDMGGVGTVEMRRHQIIPLSTSEDLAMEGARMSHCVGGYHQQCRNGQYRIFSIRTMGGEGVATLTMTRDNDQEWKRHILLGPNNRAVMPATRELADEFAEYYNQHLQEGNDNGGINP